MTQENIQGSHELDEGDPGFQLLVAFNLQTKVLQYCCLFIFFSSIYIIKFSMYLFSKPSFVF
jgi:hypothetical protein